MRVVSARRLWLLPLRLALTDTGLRVLLVSTDPASNLRDVFELATKEEPVAVGAVQGLDVMDIDPQTAAAEYRSRVIDPYRGVLLDAEITALEEKLAEPRARSRVAAFDAFARLFAEPALISTYDHVVFDTAPTGHTLRLLSLPAAWSDYLGANPDAATAARAPRRGAGPSPGLHVPAVRTLRRADLCGVGGPPRSRRARRGGHGGRRTTRPRNRSPGAHRQRRAHAPARG